ncbi:hypothetical protein BH23BAC1_BH23BAC1_09260 [soil metagenome]
MNIIRINLILYFSLSFFIFSCNPPPSDKHEDGFFLEPYRPQYHFTPERNWMNDPNGQVYFDGEYHLFYQYNPYGITWGHMSWGHAVSKDLLHWEHLPVALEEEDGIMIFSGSAAVDDNNTSGLCPPGEPCMIAIYTGHTEELQNQHIAYSHDRGRTWTKYEENPVLDINKKDFRDPKVFWHEELNQWIMSLALPTEHMISFYSSQDLKSWNFLSSFGPEGDSSRIWECPDLFKMKVAGSDLEKWVLLVSYNGEGGSDMQYFIGEFDGKKFINDNPKKLVLQPDHGSDFYAAVTWNNTPDDRRILQGWISNWQYGEKFPTFPWRSAQSIPRTLDLVHTPEGLRVAQKPVQELQKLRSELENITNISVSNEHQLETSGKALELIVEIVPGEAKEFGLKVFKGKENETLIGYDAGRKSLFIDRRNSGITNFHEAFPDIYYAPINLNGGNLILNILLDHSSIEVFGNDGLSVLTCRVFPGGDDTSVSLYSKGGDMTVNNFRSWNINSVWGKSN